MTEGQAIASHFTNATRRWPSRSSGLRHSTVLTILVELFQDLPQAANGQPRWWTGSHRLTTGRKA